MAVNAFYYDWQFWSAVVAAVALLLSQLPPIHVLLRRARIRCEVFSRIHITHTLGNPNSQWHLIVENLGGAPIRIKSVLLVFKRSGAQEFELPAQNYLRTPEAKEPVMLTPFVLKPGEEWSHIVNFFQMFTRDDTKQYRALQSATRTDITEQREKLENEEQVCEAAPEVVGRLMAFFQRHFRWEAGEYEVELRVQTDNPHADLSQRYSFSLFESEANELRDYSDGYRYGAGVYWNSENHAGLLIPIHER